MNVTAPAEHHIGALDGLRALAITLVLLFHLTPGHESNLGIRALLFKVADIGWSGVDLFFVLSGFLITGKLIAARSDRHRFRNFYARRALRILPLYYGVLLVLLLFVPVIYRTLPFASISAQLPYWLYYSNFLQKPLPTDPFIPIGHFWSLAIEEQFYLVWPAVIFFADNRIARRICLLIAVAALVLRYGFTIGNANWVATYAWTPCRADGLALGALLALIYAEARLKSHVLPWALGALAVTTPFLAWVAWRDKAYLVMKNVVAPESTAVRTLLPSAIALFFAGLLVLALRLAPLARVLSGSFLQAIARYSYGMYVAHFMLLPSLTKILRPQLLAERLHSANLAAAVFFIVGSAASTILAIASYQGYESFFLRLKPKHTPRQTMPVSAEHPE